MFKQWKTIRASNRSRSAAHGERARLRRQIERLEERAMLSVSIGQMPIADGVYVGALQNVGAPRDADAAMFAPPEYLDGGPAFQSYSTESLPVALREPRLAPMSLVQGLDSEVGGFGYASSREPVKNQFLSSPPPQPTAIYVVTIVVTNAPVMAGDFWYSPAPATPPSNAKSSLPLVSSPLKSSPLVSSPIVGPKSNSTGQGAESSPGESPLHANYSYLTSLTLPTPLAAIPTAAQIVSRNIDSAALFPAGALDAAFQSYSSRLLLVATPTTANDRTLVDSVDDAMTAHGEALSGFIRPSDLRIVDDALTSMDAVQRERDAVDAVLHDLHEFDAPLWDATSVSQNGDRAVETTVDVELRLPSSDGFSGIAPFNDAEGGMVMLEASGDANESAINLIGADDGQVDLLQSHAGVETAVGFYQAIDVATEDVPVANLPTVIPATESAPAMPSDTRFSTENETKSSDKAAAAIGATAFVGAMLWVGSKRRSDDDWDAFSASKKNCRTIAS